MGLAGEIFGHGKAAERDDDAWLYQVKLALQPFAAGHYLAGHRVAVLGRAALDHIGDEDLVAFIADHADKLVEVLAGRAHERPASLVFVPAGGFADKEEPGVLRPLSRHNLCAVPGQLTIFAALYFRVEFSQK